MVFCGHGITKIRAELMSTLAQILLLLLNMVWFFIIVQVIMSLLINFQILNRHQPVVMQVYHGLNQILEPLYRPIRRILPRAGVLDFTPLVVLVCVSILRIVVVNNF